MIFSIDEFSVLSRNFRIAGRFGPLFVAWYPIINYSDYSLGATGKRFSWRII
jgi:hypothetical protein